MQFEPLVVVSKKTTQGAASNSKLPPQSSKKGLILSAYHFKQCLVDAENILGQAR